MKVFQGDHSTAKWVVGGAFLAVFLLILVSTITTPSKPIELARQSNVDESILQALAKLTLEIEKLGQKLDKFASVLPESSPEEEAPGSAQTLPPLWGKLNTHQFLDKYNAGCRNFDNVMFENVDFTGLRLAMVSFVGSTFRFCSFERTLLSGEFNEARFVNVRFDRGSLKGNFDQVSLDHCTFNFARGNDVYSINFNPIRFENSRLRFVTFKSGLHPCAFQLHNATITDSSLEYASGCSNNRLMDATLVDTLLSPFPGPDSGQALDFKSVFCGIKQLTRLSLAGMKIRLPISSSVRELDWQNCFPTNMRKMIISESDFRNVVIVNEGYPTLLSLKEYLSQIAILDDKCQF